MYKAVSILIFLIVTSCGFKPINSAIDYNYSFKQIEISAEPLIKNELNRLFSKYKENIENSEKVYALYINGKSKKSISAKNSSGIATIYKITLSLNVTVLENDKELLNRNYSREIQYNDKSSKFELKQYENIIKRDLVREISDNILNDIAYTND